jgi:hypothetical protein
VGQLNKEQLDWITALGRAGVFGGGGKRKQVMVLTHHQGHELDGKVIDQLWKPLTDALGGGPDYWYWGHIHGAAVFKPIPTLDGRAVHARLVGHGGIPYQADGPKAPLVWTEQGNAGDPKIKNRSLNGFVLLHLDGPRLSEEFIGEDGSHRWP